MLECFELDPKGKTAMIFGKHINKYYLRYSWALLIGIAMLFFIDYMELLIPAL